jgi:hypothetical protein
MSAIIWLVAKYAEYFIVVPFLTLYQAGRYHVQLEMMADPNHENAVNMWLKDANQALPV